MKVVDTRDKIGIVQFGDLSIGDAYFDHDNNLCIKTSEDVCGDENCITYRGGSWCAEYESTCEDVVRARVTITIE